LKNVLEGLKYLPKI